MLQRLEKFTLVSPLMDSRRLPSPTSPTLHIARALPPLPVESASPETAVMIDASPAWPMTPTDKIIPPPTAPMAPCRGHFARDDLYAHGVTMLGRLTGEYIKVKAVSLTSELNRRGTVWTNEGRLTRQRTLIRNAHEVSSTSKSLRVRVEPWSPDRRPFVVQRTFDDDQMRSVVSTPRFGAPMQKRHSLSQLFANVSNRRTALPLAPRNVYNTRRNLPRSSPSLSLGPYPGGMEVPVRK